MPAARLRLLAATAALAAVLPAPPHATAAPAAWTPTLAATGAFDNLSAFPDGTAYATVGIVTAGTAGELPEQVPAPPGAADSFGYFKSTDYGRTWLPQAPPPHTGGIATTNLYVRFATPKVGYATYDGFSDLPKDPTGRLDRHLCLALSSTFRTVDGGQTWQPLCEPHLPDGKAVVPGASPLAVGRDGRTVLMTGTTGGSDCKKDPARGVVSFSTDSGEHWTRGTLPGGYAPGWSARVWDSRTAAVVAYTNGACGLADQNAVFVTTDAGRTWRKVLACKTQPLCTAVAFVSRTQLLVGHTDGTTAVTRDLGRTWHQAQWLHDPANDATVAADPENAWLFWVQAFSFAADGRHGYASTRGAGTWRTEDGGRSWVQERSHECAYQMFGVGENATATAEQAVTGGPGAFSARLAAPAGPDRCHPAAANLPAPTAVAATANGVAVRVDGTLRSAR
ncbi:MAG TPA: hypothetical protein VFQ85_19015 [Mycobacteriales bacterium]|jgi:hypothetical protein|nr:hypothetical protein [Mycobacteriales bacterium]